MKMAKDKIDVFMLEILKSLEELSKNEKHIQDGAVRTSIRELQSACRTVYLVLDELNVRLNRMEKALK